MKDARARALAAGAANSFRQALTTNLKTPSQTVLEGQYIDRLSGNAVTLNGFRYVRYAITGVENQIFATATVSGSLTALAVFYAANGTTVLGSQFAGANGADTTYTDQLLTLPAGTAFVAITGKSVGPVAIKYNKFFANIATDFDANNAAISQATEAANAARDALRTWQAGSSPVSEDGFYLSLVNGSKVANASYRYTKIPLTGNELALRASGTTNGNSMALAVYYDASGVLISNQFPGVNGAPAIYTNQILTPPANARSVAVASATTNTVKVEVLVSRDLDAAASAAASASVKADKALAPLTGWYTPNYTVNPNAYISSGGAQVSFSGYQNIVYPVTGTEQGVSATALVSGSLTSLAVYFAANGTTVLGRQFIGTNGVDTQYTSQTLTLPVGTAFIGITGKSTSAINLQILDVVPSVIDKFTLQDATNADLSARVVSLENGRGWSGKTLVWFGTSIPRGSGSNSYPPKVASILNATVVNEAYGSSMLRAGKKSAANGAVVAGSISGNVLTVTSVLYGTVAVGQTVSAAMIAGGTTTISSFGTGAGGVGTYNLSGSGSTAAGSTIFLGPDPLGWTGIPWQNIAYSLAMYVGEKDELINNWAKWRLLLTNSPPTSPDTAEQAIWRDRSFENCLVSRHLGANRKALYLLDHGHNDWSVTGDGGDMLTVPSIPDDRLTFLGAMRFIVSLILSDNQRARIAFVGHYEADRKVDIAAAQIKAAGIWQFPFYRTWERMGISQNSLTVSGTTKTVSQWRLPDDLHLHSDTTGAETTLMAQQIAAWLVTQR